MSFWPKVWFGLTIILLLLFGTNDHVIVLDSDSDENIYKQKANNFIRNEASLAWQGVRFLVISRSHTKDAAGHSWKKAGSQDPGSFDFFGQN